MFLNIFGWLHLRVFVGMCEKNIISPNSELHFFVFKNYLVRKYKCFGYHFGSVEHHQQKFD